MNKNSIITALNLYGESINKHLPAILTGVGTLFFAKTIHETYKHHDECKYELEQIEEEKGEDITTVDKTKVYFKSYKSAITYGVLSLACFYGAQGINSKRIATLATVYSMKDLALNNYIAATEDVVGKNKADKIRVRSEERMLEEKLKTKPFIPNGRHGDDLIYIPKLNLIFKGDMQLVQDAFDKTSSYVYNNREATVNYFIQQLGLIGFEGSMGDDNGWTLDRLYEEHEHNPMKCKIEWEKDATLIDDVAYILIDILDEPKPLLPI